MASCFLKSCKKSANNSYGIKCEGCNNFAVPNNLYEMLSKRIENKLVLFHTQLVTLSTDQIPTKTLRKYLIKPRLKLQTLCINMHYLNIHE